MLTDKQRARARDDNRFIATSTGALYWPTDPSWEDIRLQDIAHGLAYSTRFNGQGGGYSIAQHCVELSFAVSLENALWALLHDAPEAYIGDVVRPVKHACEEVKHFLVGLEMRNMDAIREWVRQTTDPSVEMPTDMPEQVKLMDDQIILAERRVIFEEQQIPWLVEGDEELQKKFELYSVWSSEVAKDAFMSRFDYLMRLNEGWPK